MSALKSALLASLIAFLRRNGYKKFAECAACRTRPPFRLGGCLFASDCSSQTSRATRRSLAGRGRSNYKRAMIKLIAILLPPFDRIPLVDGAEQREESSPLRCSLTCATHIACLALPDRSVVLTLEVWATCLYANSQPVSNTVAGNLRHLMFLLHFACVSISARPYSTLPWKSRLFHDLASKVNMFFPSRVYASHACVVCHAVNREHVSSRSGVYGMRVGVAAEVVKAGDHLLL